MVVLMLIINLMYQGDFDEYEETCCCVCDGDDKEGDLNDDETSCVYSGCEINDDKTPEKNFGECLKKECFLLFTG